LLQEIDQAAVALQDRQDPQVRTRRRPREERLDPRREVAIREDSPERSKCQHESVQRDSPVNRLMTRPRIPPHGARPQRIPILVPRPPGCWPARAPGCRLVSTPQFTAPPRGCKPGPLRRSRPPEVVLAPRLQAGRSENPRGRTVRSPTGVRNPPGCGTAAAG